MHRCLGMNDENDCAIINQHRFGNPRQSSQAYERRYGQDGQKDRKDGCQGMGYSNSTGQCGGYTSRGKICSRIKDAIKCATENCCG